MGVEEEVCLNNTLYFPPVTSYQIILTVPVVMAFAFLVCKFFVE